jgi:hypothetical protein
MRTGFSCAVIAILAASVCCAGRRTDSSDAMFIASAFLGGREMPGNAPSSLADGGAAVHPLLDADGTSTIAYVCEVAPTGYVVVSPDTDLSPIIAYSLESDFSWSDGPDNLLVEMLQTDMPLRLTALDQGLVSQAAIAANAKEWAAICHGSAEAHVVHGDEVVGPLIESPTWAQFEPWNLLCPTDPSTGERSSAGCVAIALAQIVSYWDYPRAVSFSTTDSYTTGTRGIPVQAEEATISCIEYGAKDYRNPSDDTMARLAFAAGVSVEMDYTSAGSGAFVVDVAAALAGSALPPTNSRDVRRSVWGYSSADVRSCTNAQWGTPFSQDAASFYGSLRENLDAGKPVLLCISAPGQSRSHAMICDGYESASNRYHLNLGWGGYTDGWYALPEAMPPGYSIVNCAILNIEPPSAVERTSSGHKETDTLTDNADSASPFGRVFAARASRDDSIIFQSTSAATASVMSVNVYDLSGALVWSETKEEADKVVWTEKVMESARLANGVYIYVVTMSDGVSTLLERGTVVVMRH